MLGYESRQSYYNALKRDRKQREEEELVLELTKGVRRILPRTGTKKVYLDIKDDIEKSGYKIGRDKVHKYLKYKDLLVKPKKKEEIQSNNGL